MSIPTVFSRSTVECPCGYTFSQIDDQNHKKVKIVERLHRKKCEIAKQHFEDILHIGKKTTLNVRHINKHTLRDIQK